MNYRIKNNRQHFIRHICSDELLDNAVEFIRDNLSPDDVFDKETLIQFVRNNMSPDEVFDERPPD